MSKKLCIGGALFACAMFIWGIWGGIFVGDLEKPKYTVIDSQQSFELRRYKPLILAQVSSSGERKEAIEKGFRILADYIFGNNSQNKKIAMTAPVLQSKKRLSSSPILLEKQTKEQRQGKINSEKSMDSAKKQWTISFVMPSEFSKDELPQAQREEISFQETSQKTYLVLRFSGMHSKGNLTKHEEKFFAYIKEHQLPVQGELQYAFYNPPWTLPFLRRNEMLMELPSSYSKLP